MIYVRVYTLDLIFKTTLTRSRLDLWGRYLCSTSRYKVLLHWRSLGYWLITVWKTHWSSSFHSMLLWKCKTISPSMTSHLKRRSLALAYF